MNDLKKYDILFTGLKNGIHHFLYKIDKSFFAHFEFSPVQDGNLQAAISFDKKENFFVLKFNIKGTIKTECDRCMNLFDLPLNSSNQIIIKFSDIEKQKNEEEADIIFISRNETNINVAQLIYEFINLSIPIKKAHPQKNKENNNCDKKTIDILNKYSPKINKETDLRWSKLSTLKTN